MLCFSMTSRLFFIINVFYYFLVFDIILLLQSFYHYVVIYANLLQSYFYYKNLENIFCNKEIKRFDKGKKQFFAN